MEDIEDIEDILYRLWRENKIWDFIDCPGDYIDRVEGEYRRYPIL